MTRTSKAKIFLAEERGLNETSSFRSQPTFNFGQYYHPHKTPLGNIQVLNDDMLDGSRSMSMLVQKDSFIVLLPVAGAIIFECSTGEKNLLAAGQVQVLHIKGGATLSISNPFKDQVVNFLQLWTKENPATDDRNTVQHSYDVNGARNKLISLLPSSVQATSLPLRVMVGKFNGRGETSFRLTDKNSGLFLFVLEGAFEAEGRLLHARDGLAIWETPQIDLEALSNGAIVLAIEYRL